MEVKDFISKLEIQFPNLMDVKTENRCFGCYLINTL